MVLAMPELEDTTSSKANAKTILECTCAGVVSCVDIIALAARDAVALSTGPFYQVPTGRRNGRSSDALMASEMPEVGETVSSFKKKFAERGLSPNNLVVLSGTKCPKDGNVNERLSIDFGSEERFAAHILSNIRMGFAVLESDAKLYTDPETKFVLDSYFETSSFEPAPSFAKDFASAMVKMGNIGAGKQGEIRRVCNAFNS